MEEKQDIKGPNFWLALGLIFIGVLFLLDNFDILDIGDLWQFWPLILIGIGILKLKSSHYQDRGSAITLLIIGVVFLLLNFDILDWGDIWQFWPVILILIGISIIYRRYAWKSNSEKQNKTLSEDRVDVVAIFGGNDKIITSDKFEGGNVTAIFGGANLDFGNAKLAAGENILNIFTMFGGTELYVPNDWHVIIKGFPIFGGFEDTRRKLPSEDLPKDKILVVKGLVIFGGLEIKTA
ncbi:MAG: LiaI-LiaF-like domain-containing protein [bacterium]